MIKHLFLIATFLLFTLSFCGSALADNPVIYSPDQQALAVNPYFDGFGGTIEIDFNADHSYAGIITQNLWHYLYGETTELGLYKQTVTVYPWGGTSTGTWYGWGDRLGSLAAAADFSTSVTTLYDGTPEPDGFRYFTPLWDVNSGQTLIYVQPATATGATPLTADALADTYIRINRGEWKSYYDLGLPVPPQVTPFDASLKVSPAVLNRKSKGQWVTVQIELPAPYLASDVDSDTVVIAIGTDLRLNGQLTEKVELSRKLANAGKNGGKLIAKFDREQLMALTQVSGDVEVSALGKLFDGTPFSATTTLTLLH